MELASFPAAIRDHRVTAIYGPITFDLSTVGIWPHSHADDNIAFLLHICTLAFAISRTIFQVFKLGGGGGCG